jgi:hypothetical protein
MISAKVVFPVPGSPYSVHLNGADCGAAFISFIVNFPSWGIQRHHASGRASDLPIFGIRPQLVNLKSVFPVDRRRVDARIGGMANHDPHFPGIEPVASLGPIYREDVALERRKFLDAAALAAWTGALERQRKRHDAHDWTEDGLCALAACDSYRIAEIMLAARDARSTSEKQA